MTLDEDDARYIEAALRCVDYWNSAEHRLAIGRDAEAGDSCHLRLHHALI